ncbi:MAG: lysylphosphatidylglycerol synthase domain-containing protein [Gammaproteobacteria bacterium]
MPRSRGGGRGVIEKGVFDAYAYCAPRTTPFATHIGHCAMTLRHGLRICLRPTFILPVLLAAALLVLAFNLGNLGNVLGRIQALSIATLSFALAMGLCYLLLKLWQLHLLLADLDLHPGWRRLCLAFAVGELSLTLPFGVFAQNWILSRHRPVHFGRSSAATVVMLLVEALAVLVFLAVVGVPGWPELAPLAAAFAIGLLVLVAVALRLEPFARRLVQRVRQPVMHRILVEALELLLGLKRLSNPRVLIVNVAIAVLYLAALTLAFTAVGHGVGLPHLSYLAAASIYAFSLAVLLICGGLVSQIGTLEILGMGAALAWGFSFTDGLALMFGFRIVWTGVMWLLNLPVVVFLWRTLLATPTSVDNLEEAPHGTSL